MSTALTVARKETRALFLSPVAVIFLGVFLFVAEFTVFTLDGFFARNLADVRPLFGAMPLLLILLVSALTMKLWAEERRQKTFEVLLTLPIRTWDLVLGKFLAGLGLVLLALLLTLPIPIAVSTIGPLDWGPVVGGYVGALLLASAYLAMGLCMSAVTDNQVVALMLTLVVGGLLYLLGADHLASLLTDSQAQVLRSLGTGTRFESIERGVLDLRDLVYYLTLTAVFLGLNAWIVDRTRRDRTSEQGRRRAGTALVTVGLLTLNAMALDAWLAPLHGVRVDLTADKAYSISPVSDAVLADLSEPLQVQALFSERTHPMLAPLAARIKDYLVEYEARGGGRVSVEFLDPSKDEELQELLGEQYSIRSFPFRVSGRNEQSVVNSYFHILLKYGDKYQVLSWEDLVDVHMEGDDVQVGLSNLEYDLTRAVKRVSQDFQSVESIFARLDQPARLSLFVSRETLPGDLVELPPIISVAANEFVEKSGGNLTYVELDPSTDQQLAEQIYKAYGIRPKAVDLFGAKTYYFDLLLEMGDKVVRIPPQGGSTEADVKGALTAAFKRATPGSRRTIAVLTEVPEAPPPDPKLPPQYQPPAPQPDYQTIQRALSGEVEVKQVDLADGTAPEDADILLVAKPGAMTDRQRFAVDQFLMRGGAVVALASRYTVKADRSGLAGVPQDAAWLDMLKTWGVTVDEGMVADPHNRAFPVPITERKGALMMRRVEFMDYPFFVDVRGEGLSSSHVALSGLTSLTVPWASPLEVAPLEGVTSDVLLRSSEDSWISTSGDIMPDFEKSKAGFQPEGATGSHVLGVALQGTFPSSFADAADPTWDVEGEGDRTGRTIKQSMPDARLVVVGSSELTSDLLLALARQMGGDVDNSSMVFLQNLLDWATEDADLLQIRSAGAFARTLEPMEESEQTSLELMIAFVMLAGLLAAAFVPRFRRANQPSLIHSAKEVRS